MAHALILGGGGAKGAWEAGAAAVLWRHFEEAGEPFRILSGTSVGALNAAALIQGGPDLLLELWGRISRDQVFSSGGWLCKRARRAWRTLRGTGALYSSRPLRKLLERELEPATLRDSPITLLVHAFDIDAGLHVTFDNRSPFLLEGIYASASIPIAFPEVRLGPLALVDGGVVANLPIRSVREEGATRVTAIHLDYRPPIRRVRADEALLPRLGVMRPRRSLLGEASAVLDAMMRAQVERDLSGAELVNRILGDVGELPPYRRLRIDRLHPHVPLGHTLDFDRAHLDRLVRLGQVNAEDWLASRASELPWPP